MSHILKNINHTEPYQNPTLADFYLVNKWTKEPNGGLKDQSTGKIYPPHGSSNNSKEWIGVQCFFLTIATPVLQPIALVANIAYRTIKLVSLSHLWIVKSDEGVYSLKGRLKDGVEDFLRIVFSPFALLGFELVAIYGMFSPYDGRKLYTSIEIGLYRTPLVSPNGFIRDDGSS